MIHQFIHTWIIRYVYDQVLQSWRHSNTFFWTEQSKSLKTDTVNRIPTHHKSHNYNARDKILLFYSREPLSDVPTKVTLWTCRYQRLKSNWTWFLENWSMLIIFEVRCTAVLIDNFPPWRHCILFFIYLAEAYKKISQQVNKKVVFLY